MSHSSWHPSSLRHNIPFLIMTGMAVSLLFWNISGSDFVKRIEENKEQHRQQEMMESIFPRAGVASGIHFGNSIAALITSGAIDSEKFQKLYEARGGMPSWVEQLIAGQGKNDEIIFSEESAPYLLNLLWAIGLTNQAEFNAESPVNQNRYNLAATGGWTLGKEQNGGIYFNSSKIVSLTPEQEEMVRRMAEHIFRPCCNNSTFFQDCNHGSAMLGLLMLGASQGVSEENLYHIALAANSYWFPEEYVNIATYFQKLKNMTWEEVDPKMALETQISSASGIQNVTTKLQQAGLLPPPKSGSGAGCSA